MNLFEHSYRLSVGQRQYVYFYVVSDGTLIKGKMLDARRIEFRAEGNGHPSALPQSFETRVWIQSNKYPPSRFLSVQYRYALTAAQNSTGDTVPVGATRANEYRIQMKPGQEKELHFWIAAQDDRVHMQKISIQYLPTL